MAREPGHLANTRFFFACGEKATIAEGSRNGLYYEMIAFNGVQQQVSDMLGKMDDWRGPMTYPIGARAGRWSSTPPRGEPSR